MSPRHKKPADDPKANQTRVWIKTSCVRCQRVWWFWRYFKRRPEYRVCAHCACEQWILETIGRSS